MNVINNSYLLPNPLRASSHLPAGVAPWLQGDHPRLSEIRARYAAARHPALTPSVWDDVHTTVQLELPFFRGDNAYIWQKRDNNEHVNYLLTAYYYQQADTLGLFDRLCEDDAFGIFTYPYRDGKLLSRDLLDSIGEILFLEQTLQLSMQTGWNVLDIGAGYGRLAHRMMTALPQLGRYFCVDVVPESSFLAEFYLHYRAVDERAKVVLLDEVGQWFANTRIDLALNIHSFSECTAAAARFWLDLLQQHKVPYLLVVPNPLHEGGKTLYSKEMDGSEPDLLPVITAAGYRLCCSRPKYLDPGVQQFGVTPTWYHLFQLAN